MLSAWPLSALHYTGETPFTVPRTGQSSWSCCPASWPFGVSTAPGTTLPSRREVISLEVTISESKSPLYISQCWSELQPCRADHFFLTQQGCMESWNASLITTGHPYAAMHISHMLMSQNSVFQRDTLAKLKTLVLCLPFLFKISSRERSRRERLMLKEDMSSTHPTVKKNPSSQASFIRIDRTCILTLSRALEVPLCPFSSVSDQSSSFGPSVWAAHAGWEKGWTKGAYIAWSAPRPTGRTASCTTVLPHLNASSKNTLHPGVIWLQSEVPLLQLLSLLWPLLGVC